MKINVISNQNFNAKKFRLPVKFVKNNNNPIPSRDLYASKDTVISGNFVREYNNPKAEEYFNKALDTSDLDEKFKYLEKMGEYRIIDITAEQQIDKFINAVDNMP